MRRRDNHENELPSFFRSVYRYHKTHCVVLFLAKNRALDHPKQLLYTVTSLQSNNTGQQVVLRKKKKMGILADERRSRPSRQEMGNENVSKDDQAIDDAMLTLGRFFGVGLSSTQQQQQLNVSPSHEEEDEEGRTIRFNSSVDIVTIPSHTTYSDTIKQNLYSSSYEIRQNAQRNRREFAAEQWKWENAVEEDQMFFDKRSNEHIHPVHLGGIMDLMR